MVELCNSCVVSIPYSTTTIWQALDRPFVPLAAISLAHMLLGIAQELINPLILRHQPGNETSLLSAISIQRATLFRIVRYKYLFTGPRSLLFVTGVANIKKRRPPNVSASTHSLVQYVSKGTCSHEHNRLKSAERGSFGFKLWAGVNRELPDGSYPPP